MTEEIVVKACDEYVKIIDKLVSVGNEFGPDTMIKYATDWIMDERRDVAEAVRAAREEMRERCAKAMDSIDDKNYGLGKIIREIEV